MKKLLYLFILLSQFLTAGWAQESFVVRNIKIEGLRLIRPETVENYLTIKRGETLRPGKTSDLLRALYKTGFFDKISLSRKGHTLIIHVIERPTIGQLKISGNSIVKTDKLTAVMKTLDIAEGRIYNPAILEKIKQSLLNQYYQLGRYNARVHVRVTPMSRNRVFVKITISEGLSTKIRHISILGAQTFPEKTLLKQLDITPSNYLTLVTQTDRYSEDRLEASLQKLREFYLDHGYLHFEVKSSQAQLTPDRKAVYITITVEEGPIYTVKSYTLDGQYILPKEELLKLVTIKPGEIFSRQKVIESEKAISKYLGDKGYIFTTVGLRPEVNEVDHTIAITFQVKAGKRAYVRHVTFTDNNRTNDNVLRREIEQMEAAPVSTSRLETSKHRLQMLSYIKEVDMSVKPVPEIDDQVDVNYKIKEDNTAQLSAKIGYSQLQGFVLGGGFNHKNFFGTGNTLGFNLQASKFEQYYSFDYTNPYYTEDGISRSFILSVSRTNPGKAKGVVNDYTTNEYNFGVLYSIPVGNDSDVFSRIQAGVTYQNTLVRVAHDLPENPFNPQPPRVSNQVKDFVRRHGRHFQELDFKLGFSRDSRDRAIFPTDGDLQTIFADVYAPLDKHSLSYYTINYSGRWFKPLTQQFIFTSRADIGYGNGFHGGHDFPFFRNYFVGGIGSVRGYTGFTLGPLDSTGKAYGGNILVDGSIGLIFPNFISENIRTTAFVDAGNVFTTLDNRQFGGSSTNSGPIRFSVGLDLVWLTPFGAPVELSVAYPFRRAHDKKEMFQFALGANF